MCSSDLIAKHTLYQNLNATAAAAQPSAPALQINTVTAAAASAATANNMPSSAVPIDGVAVDFDHDMSADGKLRVHFPASRITRSGQEIDIRFQTLLTVSGTEFRAEVSDSQSDAFAQRVAAGDASSATDENTLVVSAKIEDELFAGVDFSSAIVTPNGDRINDELTLNYILLKATDPVSIRVIVHNLAGQEIVRIYDQRDLSGPNQVTWDGRDAAGQVVPPGLYLVRLSADTDAGKTTEMRSVAVVY